MIAYKRDGADPGERSFIDSQTQLPRTQNIRCHLRLRIAMSSVKRFQEEHRVVNIRFIEPELLDGLNLAGNPFAQLPAFKGRVTLKFDLKLARVCEMTVQPASSYPKQAAAPTPAAYRSEQKPGTLPSREPESGRGASFESQEVFDLPAEITADTQPADKDKLIRQRNTQSCGLFARSRIYCSKIELDPAKKRITGRRRFVPAENAAIDLLKEKNGGAPSKHVRIA